MARKPQRFTVYDALDARGVFSANPANADAVDESGIKTYKGPQAYPRMLYHPEGAERITVPGEVLATALGPKMVGEQREIIHRIVNDEQEEKEALAAGWHKTPSAAMTAAGKDAPPVSAGKKIEELEEEIRRLQAERNTAAGALIASAAPSGVAVKKPN